MFFHDQITQSGMRSVCLIAIAFVLAPINEANSKSTKPTLVTITNDESAPIPVTIQNEPPEERIFFRNSYTVPMGKRLLIDEVSVLCFFANSDGFRRPERFRKMTQACIADARGRTRFENDPYPPAEYANRLLEKLNALDLQPVLQRELKGKKLGEAISKFRLDYLKTITETPPVFP